MAEIANDEIEHDVPLDSLTAHPDNPRQGDIGAISESLEAHGFYGVVVAQRSTRRVLAGNHRIVAARAQGLDAVPVAWLDINDDEALRILLVDNRTNDLATYDDQTLAQLLTQLSANLDGTGYDPEDLNQLLTELAAPLHFAPEHPDWPELRIRLTPETHARWTALAEGYPDERAAFEALLDLT